MDSLQAQFILLPILLPLVGAGVAILVRKNYRFQQIWSLGILTASLVVSLWLLISVQNRGAPIVYQLGNWSASIGIVLVADLLAAFFVLMVQLVMVAGLVYALGSKDDVTCYPMFYPLFLTMATSLSGAFLTGDLFNLYVFAELLDRKSVV